MVKRYEVAQHPFTVTMSSEEPLWGGMDNYAPFLSEGEEVLFNVEVCDSVLDVVLEGEKPIFTDRNQQVQILQITIFRATCGGWLFELTQIDDPRCRARIHISADYSLSRVELHGDVAQRAMLLNNAVILSYMCATASRKTLLIHASSVLHRGQAYLFIGRSGTGKSTHSRMWREVDGSVELLNDDHPILRAHDSGEVIAYGSPWSGKTPCYRNLSACVGGIVRIKQSPSTHIARQRGAKAYGSLFTSSGIRGWDQELMDHKANCIAQIIERVGVWELNCRADKEAAQCAMSNIVEGRYE